MYKMSRKSYEIPKRRAAPVNAVLVAHTLTNKFNTYTYDTHTNINSSIIRSVWLNQVTTRRMAKATL